ncbi:MAG: hypothetical protein NC489_25625 [Ruminococcus flavefaciens]|nr:hypothetical protein [Ruminococcus flavefaciens]
MNMLLDLLAIYIAGAIICASVCGFVIYQDMKKNEWGKSKDDIKAILKTITIAFLFWPILVIAAIILTVQEESDRKKK